MNRAIWKFPLEVEDVQNISMPVGSAILSAQWQNGSICIWAMVTPEMERENRVFEVIGTGHPINPCIRRDFIGTVQIPEMGLVFHVFEVVP